MLDSRLEILVFRCWDWDAGIGDGGRFNKLLRCPNKGKQCFHYGKLEGNVYRYSMTDFYSGFFLGPNDGNMQLSCPEQALWVAPLLKMGSLDEVESSLLIDEAHLAFAEKGQLFHGLKWFLQGCNRSVYVFDNHNHALFFWYQAYMRTKKVCTLVHIDQHSDMNENFHPFSLVSEREVFDFVQQHTTVGNFIQPALKSGLISRVQLILTEYSLQRLQLPSEPYILDLDLDFFAPEMGISLEQWLPKLRELMQYAECVTIATSPYFLEQKKAVAMVKRIFTEFSFLF